MRWLSRPRATSSAELQLFCFPYAGGGPNVFRRWARLLPASVEVHGVALPGRAFRLDERPRDRLGQLADELATEFLDLPHAPFAFFGHSFGGLLSFEIARRLDRAGAPLPVELFVSACPPPHLRPPGPAVHGLPDGAFKERLRELGGTPVPVLDCAELMNLVLPVLRADLTAFETHRHEPGPPLPVRMTAFGGADDRLVEPETLDGWRLHTCERFAVRVFPGDHFFVHSDEEAVVAAVAATLGS
jgi:medium-chain acyl-[acyl-carrier-protein] hydrolase